MCPFGGLQDFLSLIARKLKIKQRNILPREIHLLFIPLRYFIYISFMLGVGFAVFAITNFDARRVMLALLNKRSVQIVGIASLSIFAVLSLFYKRVFCNYFCYEGVQFAFRNAFRLFTIKRNKETCISCRKCDAICPSSINVSKCDDLHSLQCVNCFQCISECPKSKTLKYGFVTPEHTVLGKLILKFSKTKHVSKLQKVVCIIFQIILLVIFTILINKFTSYLRGLK